MTELDGRAPALASPVIARLDLALLALDALALRRDPQQLLLTALYRIIRETTALSEDIRERLHHGQPKPLALSPLLWRRGEEHAPASELTVIPPGSALSVRLTTLDSATLSALALVLSQCRDGLLLTLDHARWRLRDWRLAAEPADFPALISYADLYARSQPETDVALRFTSPVSIRSGNAPVAPADLAARHVFGGYLERWRAFSPTEMAGVERDRPLEAVRLTALDLRPARHARLPTKTPAGGHIGTARFQFEGDDETRRRLAALAAYAVYCGTGSATAWGMGQTERIDPSG